MQALDPVMILNDHLIVGQHAGDLEERLFHLLGEEVDAGDDEHIVPSAVDRFQTEMGSAAGALVTGDDPGKVTGPEADHGDCFPGQRRDHDFTGLTVRQDLAGFRINDLDDVMVFPRVDPGVCGAIHPQRTDPAGLGHAVNIKGLDPESVLNAFFHGSGEGFRAEDPDLEVGQFRIVLIQQFHDPDRIRDHAGHNFRAEILRQFDLTRRVPCPGGDHKKSRFPGAVITAETAVEQPEAGRDLAGIAGLGARHHIAACHTFRPLSEVIFRVRHHNGRTGTAAGHVHFLDGILFHAAHSQGIFPAEVFLAHKGEFLQVGNAVEVGAALKSGSVHTAAEVGIMLHGVSDGMTEPGVLQCGEFVAGHGLGFFVEVKQFAHKDLPSSKALILFSRNWGFTLRAMASCHTSTGIRASNSLERTPTIMVLARRTSPISSAIGTQSASFIRG